MGKVVLKTKLRSRNRRLKNNKRPQPKINKDGIFEGEMRTYKLNNTDITQPHNPIFISMFWT